MNRLFGRVGAAMLIVILTVPSSALAQATGEFAGRVMDESGGVLPGVTVTATQTGTGFVRTVVTDAEGRESCSSARSTDSEIRGSGIGILDPPSLIPDPRSRL